MISEILWALASPFVMFFGEKPSDDPDTAQLISFLQGYNVMDSVIVFKNSPKELQKIGSQARIVDDSAVRIEKSKSGMESIQKSIVEALIYPPDDIWLCTDVVGYAVFYKGHVADTIVIDAGAKHLRHKINGELKYSYYQGDIWQKIAVINREKNGCHSDDE